MTTFCMKLTKISLKVKLRVPNFSDIKGRCIHKGTRQTAQHTVMLMPYLPHRPKKIGLQIFVGQFMMVKPKGAWGRIDLLAFG